MLTRQRLVLALINLSGGSMTRLQLVKQAFLLREYLSPRYLHSFYQFLPYQYGPFSFTLYRDLGNLAAAGLITLPSSRTIEITDKASRLATTFDYQLSQDLDKYWSAYGKYRVNQLVDLVYNRYPWYASRSKRMKHHEPREDVDCAVYTVGYEGTQVDGFLDLLLRSGIRSIVDVRKNAVSRVYGFYGPTLANLAKRIGIGYRHLPELGVPSSWRVRLDSKADLDMLFARYRGELLPTVEGSVKHVASWMNQKPSVLMCMEVDPTRCHRSVLARAVSDISGLGICDLRWEDGEISDNTCANHGHDLSPSLARI